MYRPRRWTAPTESRAARSQQCQRHTNSTRLTRPARRSRTGWFSLPEIDVEPPPPVPNWARHYRDRCSLLDLHRQPDVRCKFCSVQRVRLRICLESLSSQCRHCPSRPQPQDQRCCLPRMAIRYMDGRCRESCFTIDHSDYGFRQNSNGISVPDS